MTVLVLTVTVYLVLIVLPGALNSLVNARFKTCFVTRIALLVVGSSLLLQQDCWCGCGLNSEVVNIVLIDGLCKLTGNSFICESVLKIVGLFLLALRLNQRLSLPEQPLIQQANLIGIVSLLSSNDWLVTVTCWEELNLSLYLVVTISYQGALSASVKYFLLSALTSTFMLLAVAVFYASAGTSQYDMIVFAIAMEGSASYDLVIELLVVALLLKLGAAPLHVWAPDLYDSVPLLIALWMILIPKLAVVFFILNLPFSFGGYSYLIVMAGVISMVLGSVGLTSQWRIKRLLAYSAISNLGFILLTIGLFMHDSSLYYITIYAVNLISLFAILAISSGLSLWSNPLVSIVWALNSFSLAGMPPLAGFYAKFLVVSSIGSLDSLTIGIVIASALSAANYLSLVKVSMLDLPKRLFLLRCPAAVSYLISFGLFFVVAFIVIYPFFDLWIALDHWCCYLYSYLLINLYL